MKGLFLSALTAVLIGIGAMSANAQVGGGFDLSWNTIDGGGATFSTGGNFKLGGTIGQHDASLVTMTGGNFKLTGGFWAGVSSPNCGSSDTNSDGCVNDFDLAAVIFDFGGAPSGSNGNTDITCDNVVDDFDLAQVIFDFGQGCL